MIKKFYYVACIMLLFSLGSCGDDDTYFDLPVDPEFEDPQTPDPEPEPEPAPTTKTYTNPLVITDESNNVLDAAVILDPTILKVDDIFYLYSASEGWSDGSRPLIGIYKSKDLVNWTFIKGAIDTDTYKPIIGDWLQGIKAFTDNGKYCLYFYNNNNIMCFVSDTPDGNFVAYNDTDDAKGDGVLKFPTDYAPGYDGLPSFITEGDKKYLMFRNRTEEWNTNLCLIEMKDYATFQDPINVIKISDDNLQCPSIMKLKDKYFVISKNAFYFGAAPFKILTSDSLTGNYTDTGKNFLDSEANINGIDAIVCDDNNDYWALYSKWIDKHVLCLDKVLFDKEDIPYIKDLESSTTEQDAPYFKSIENK